MSRYANPLSLFSFVAASLALAASSAAAPVVLTGSLADFERNEDGSAGAATSPALRVGASSTLGGGRNAIYVFDLTPFALSGDVLSSADFQLTLSTKSGTPAFNADFYGVGYSTSAATPPAGADYYEGVFPLDNTNTSNLFALQNDFATPATAAGAVLSSDAGADTQLVTMINTRPVGSNFLWLRLSPDADAGSAGALGYNFGAAENTTPSARPLLGLNQQVPEPAALSAAAAAAAMLLVRRRPPGARRDA